jgi:hypothetical protein
VDLDVDLGGSWRILKWILVDLEMDLDVDLGGSWRILKWILVDLEMDLGGS